jgi:energy-coupling factor transporter ATP-binding protein EcfA2
LDGGNGLLVRFAADLRQLREQAGSPTYRELSRRAYYSAAALSDAAGGRKLPSLAVALAYVAACGGDTTAWEQRWRTIASELADTTTAQPTNGAVESAPYVGLAAFQPEDADRFFGREHLVAQLSTRVTQQRFVVVIGPSGSGKSSVLRAGLIHHHVRSQGLATTPDSPLLIMTPGPYPLDECAARLAALIHTSPTPVHEGLRTNPRSLHLTALQALSGQPPNTELLIVVDQFEEIFTLCQNSDERTQFLQVLRSAADAPNSRTRVVLGIRADFYGHCTHHPELIDTLRDAVVPVGPMRTEELRSAIIQPALNAGLRVETSLVSQMIADSTGQPGMLPLLSHALLETWRRRQGTTLTLAGYLATGGITQSIARTAETVYAALSERQQQWARQLFIRLVALGEGSGDTKRRLPRAELELDDPANIAVVERLAQARLLMLDRDSVEISHEALIRCWPRLHEWLTTDREGIRIHRQLTEAANTWESLRHDPGALYRGGRLDLTDQWATTSGDGMLTVREREFLRASLTVQTAEQTAVRRRTRRLGQMLALLTVLLVAAGTATGYAIHAQRQANDQRNRALAQNVLSQATALNATNSALAWQLGVAAYRLAPLPDVRGALLTMMSAPFATPLTDPGKSLGSVAFTPNGHLLATSGIDQSATSLSSPSSDDVRLWDVSDSAHPRGLARLTGLTVP